MGRERQSRQVILKVSDEVLPRSFLLLIVVHLSSFIVAAEIEYLKRVILFLWKH